MRELRGLEPVARREHAVARSGRAAALHVAEHGDAGLEAGALLDLVAEHLADAASRASRARTGRSQPRRR